MTNPIEAIGAVTLEFAELDDQISAAISFLVGNIEEVGEIITAELSFKQKLHGAWVLKLVVVLRSRHASIA